MSMNFKKTIGYISISLLCCFFLVLYSFAKDETESVKDKVVASVNGKEITQDDLDREIVNISHAYSSQMQGQSLPDDLESKALDTLITRHLLYKASQDAQIEVDEKKVDENIEQTIARFPDKETFESVLKQENVTLDELKLQIRHGLAIQTYVEDMFVSKATISDEEIKTYYDSNPDLFKHPEMVEASHILISFDAGVNDDQKAEARKKVEDLAKRIENGEDFAELAEMHSDCPSSSNGGDLGFFSKGQMVKPFEDAAFSLEPGEVSSVVETPFGFHIIKVTEKQAEGAFPQEQVKPQIQQMLTREKVQKLLEEEIENLKAKAEIKKYKKFD